MALGRRGGRFLGRSHTPIFHVGYGGGGQRDGAQIKLSSKAALLQTLSGHRGWQSPQISHPACNVPSGGSRY